MIRKFKRDHYRKQVGNDNLKNMWRFQQKKKYGALYNIICVYPQRNK